MMSTMNSICIFEDQEHINLTPLTFLRPAYDLLIGIDTLFDKIYRYFHYANITLHCRQHIKSIVKKNHPRLPINKINTGTSGLFINGRTIMTPNLFKTLKNMKQDRDFLLTHQGQVIAAYLSNDNLKFITQQLEQPLNAKSLIEHLRTQCVCRELSDVHIINSASDLIALNSPILNMDFEYKNQPGIIKGSIQPFTALYNENNIFIDNRTVIEDFVVCNAKNGPIFIEKDVYIQSGTRLEGPLYIGEKTKILGGKITASSIGPNCKVAGEVSHSILLTYTNKAHDGFLGHSYLGSWVNLGAFTTTSNLKNTYNPVSLEINNKKAETNQQFLGTLFGDHTKTGINTSLTAGTIIGYGSHIYGTGLHNKSISPFSWGTPQHYEPYLLDKFFTTISKAMKRRDIVLLDEERTIIENAYAYALSKTI